MFLFLFFCSSFLSKVGNYLRLFRGTLYKKYPSLWRRSITLEERKWLIERGMYNDDEGILLKMFGFHLGCSESSLPTNLTLLRATEVDELLSGHDKKYRALTMNTETTTTRT